MNQKTSPEDKKRTNYTPLKFPPGGVAWLKTPNWEWNRKSLRPDSAFLVIRIVTYQ